MNNLEFLSILKNSYYEYINYGARSNKKLINLHGAIAEDLNQRLGDQYAVYSLGYGGGKEKNINGRYFNKRVDVVIQKNDVAVAGIAVKFVMSNYQQNSINYFEDMLGETANIRSNKKKYFQIVILCKNMPYFATDKETKKKYISRIEHLTKHNLEKYIKLANDNETEFLHTPDKSFISIIEKPLQFHMNDSYETFIDNHRNNHNWAFKYATVDNVNFDETNTILNDYNSFMEKIVHIILGI